MPPKKRVEEGLERARAKDERKAAITKRAVALQRHEYRDREIAEIITSEGLSVSESTIRRYLYAALKPPPLDGRSTARLREKEIDKVESAARKLRKQLDRMEEEPDHLFDAEMFAKMSETYLKYRDRIARLRGLDQGGNNGSLKDLGKAASQLPAEQHLHVHMPGSVEAFEEWRKLQDLGLTTLANEVLELEAGAPDEAVTGTVHQKAGTTLAPNAVDELLGTE